MNSSGSKLILQRREGNPKNVRTGWLWAPCGVRHAGNKAIRLDFWAAFLSYFLFPPKRKYKKNERCV